MAGADVDRTNATRLNATKRVGRVVHAAQYYPMQNRN